MGVDEGLAKDQPGVVRRSSRLMIGDRGTERLIVVVSLSQLTVGGTVADAESGGES